MTTTLVTGATSNVGRPLVTDLLDAGVTVRALTRHPGSAGLPAAVQLVTAAADGLRGSIDRVAKLAGTTRTAVYRRVKSRGELVVGLLVHRFGVNPAPDSGELRRDLRLLQEIQLAFFTDPRSPGRPGRGAQRYPRRSRPRHCGV
jgi:uncharacterized protein YbjT (DUF2867 family)